MIRVVQYGLGPIGLSCARAVLDRDGLQLAGAVEVDPEKIGVDISELLGLETETGVIVHRAEDALASGEADVVIHTTSSSLDVIRPELESLIDAGLNIVSSGEELFYPWFRSPDLARALDRRAREAGVVVLGAGVNPGFVLDTLPTVLTLACREVGAIRARRVVDVATRRLPLQRKLGVGLDLEAFRAGVAEGRLGHRGTPEAVAFIADALGWSLQDVREQIEPVVAEVDITGNGRTVRRGQVTGVSQVAVGVADGRELVRLEIQMYMDATDVGDRIEVDGEPSIRVEIQGGVPGDLATTSVLVNLVPEILELEPGLRTMKDVPLPRWSGRYLNIS